MKFPGKAEAVADAILKRIINESLADGVILGTEATLASEYGISRPTMREALRLLEAQRVVDTRPGPGQGVAVRRPAAEGMADALSVYLRMHKVPFDHVLEARAVIEPALAARAALRGTPEDFAVMAATIERMEALQDGDHDIEQFAAMNREFHTALAKASANMVLGATWQAIERIADGVEYGVKFTRTNCDHVALAHKEILRACLDRDADAAAAAMVSHIDGLDRLVARRHSDLLQQARTGEAGAAR